MTTVTIHQRTFTLSRCLLRSLHRESRNDESAVIRKQLVRAGMSIGANVIEAQHASSKQEFLRYMQIALRSARETEYWLRLSRECNLITNTTLDQLLAENGEIAKIIASILLNRKTTPVLIKILLPSFFILHS